MINAVLATEDVRFFKHGGIDFRRLAGAVLANVTRGFGAEGRCFNSYTTSCQTIVFI